MWSLQGYFRPHNLNDHDIYSAYPELLMLEGQLSLHPMRFVSTHYFILYSKNEMLKPSFCSPQDAYRLCENYAFLVSVNGLTSSGYNHFRQLSDSNTNRTGNEVDEGMATFALARRVEPNRFAWKDQLFRFVLDRCIIPAITPRLMLGISR